MVKKMILLFSLLLSFSIFAAKKENQIIVSQKKPVFNIVLKSNPTTGFSWKLKSYNQNLITFVRHRFIAPQNKKLMGAPGCEEFIFKANKGSYRVNQVGYIKLEYIRPWTNVGATSKTFVVVIKAK